MVGPFLSPRGDARSSGLPSKGKIRWRVHSSRRPVPNLDVAYEMKRLWHGAHRGGRSGEASLAILLGGPLAGNPPGSTGFWPGSIDQILRGFIQSDQPGKSCDRHLGHSLCPAKFVSRFLQVRSPDSYVSSVAILACRHMWARGSCDVQ